ncbi:hypothetical protein AOXY_G19200 [Acipenser oxyrinchus oxyrinchus]|uniref:Uncharacterized protein n=1 Tax=Acipenser oxyrinchus oxyrinchus TaxID=40147 RepID=A0AAD8FZ68_ACIOX|nr:hypothetical protein AOXY_G19200 [Acipenser oxyrinchus oxyrinchus]
MCKVSPEGLLLTGAIGRRGLDTCLRTRIRTHLPLNLGNKRPVLFFVGRGQAKKAGQRHPAWAFSAWAEEICVIGVKMTDGQRDYCCSCTFPQRQAPPLLLSKRGGHGTARRKKKADTFQKKGK